MKTDEQALTEWVNDEIAIKAVNKTWCFTRAQTEELVRQFLRRQDILISKFQGDVPMHVYGFFPVNTLREFFGLFDKGGTITAQEFARCETVADIGVVLSYVRNSGVSK
jgi:hypothetical protein